MLPNRVISNVRVVIYNYQDAYLLQHFQNPDQDLVLSTAKLGGDHHLAFRMSQIYLQMMQKSSQILIMIAVTLKNSVEYLRSVMKMKARMRIALINFGQRKRRNIVSMRQRTTKGTDMHVISVDIHQQVRVRAQAQAPMVALLLIEASISHSFQTSVKM